MIIVIRKTSQDYPELPYQWFLCSMLSQYYQLMTLVYPGLRKLHLASIGHKAPKNPPKNLAKFHSRLNMPWKSLGKKPAWTVHLTRVPRITSGHAWKIPNFLTHVNLLNPRRVGRYVNMVGSDAFEGRSSTQMRHLFNPDDEHTPQLTHSTAAAESINPSPFPSLSRSLVEYHQFGDGSKPTSNCCSCYTA